jgi:hypothetical protein
MEPRQIKRIVRKHLEKQKGRKKQREEYKRMKNDALSVMESVWPITHEMDEIDKDETKEIDQDELFHAKFKKIDEKNDLWHRSMLLEQVHAELLDYFINREYDLWLIEWDPS